MWEAEGLPSVETAYPSTELAIFKPWVGNHPPCRNVHRQDLRFTKPAGMFFKNTEFKRSVHPPQCIQPYRQFWFY